MENRNWEQLIQSLIKERLLHTPKVIKAMRTVPREDFLPPDMKPYAAVDTPLPIGFGQTASAPHSTDAIVWLGDTWFP